ncbi:MAG: HlyC/CorC family transporter [Pseudomonadota bacterium]|nr:HlyC/CorC family transporter [Pseudomonadota bacterium]
MNDDAPLGLLFGLLIVLLFLSAFFASTETALVSLNRYRLRHRARSGHRPAQLAEKLLERPDRLMGLILLGNNAVNLTAAAMVTVISIRLGGEEAIIVGTMILTFVILIFAEVAPKTIAALHPSSLALPAAIIYYPLMKLAYPFVWLINLVANSLLWVFGVRVDSGRSDSLSADELRSVLAESAAFLPDRHKRMLLSILDLDDITVDDVMVPRQEIVGIDLEEPWETNLAIIRESPYSRLPVFRDDFDNIEGLVRLRRVLPDLAEGTLTEQRLLDEIQEPYFVPEGTPLNKQLVNFQLVKQRSSLVVDEYGDVQGLITTGGVIREIVGELDADSGPTGPDVSKQSDDCFIVNASANIRELNRLMNWELPTKGPKTLNGLIIELLETIPAEGTGLTIGNYPIEILETAEHGVKKVRMSLPTETAQEKPPAPDSS